MSPRFKDLSYVLVKTASYSFSEITLPKFDTYLNLRGERLVSDLFFLINTIK